jgi:electron transport complex protein RnfG
MPNKSILLKSMSRSALKLSLFIMLSIILLLVVRNLTQPLIIKAEQQNLLDTFEQVLPKALYNNDPLEDVTTINHPELIQKLGQTQEVKVYRAFHDQKPIGIIFKTIATNGYSGNIEILVAILADNQRVSGVRVLKHKETPGLGDKIEINKSNWILEFSGRNLRDDNRTRWAVKKDNGDFDQFTGATITPRAVINAVKNALEVANKLGDSIYE